MTEENKFTKNEIEMWENINSGFQALASENEKKYPEGFITAQKTIAELYTKFTKLIHKYGTEISIDTPILTKE